MITFNVAGPRPSMRHVVGMGALMAAALLAVADSHAQSGDAAAQAFLKRYAGSYDTDAFLREPAVRSGLQKLLGRDLPKLEQNLEVRADVGLVGGSLSLAGNASHGGGEEEAVVCVAPSGRNVEAAIYSRGRVTAYGGGGRYDNLTLCIKDWITLARSQHVDRLKQPGDVSMAGAAPPVRNLSGNYAYQGSGAASVAQTGADVRILFTWTPIGGGPHYEARGQLTGDTINGQWYSHYHRTGWFRFVGLVRPDGSIDITQSDDPNQYGVKRSVLVRR
jgi:hypothetical protein